MADNKNFIKKAIKRPGVLRAKLGAKKGENIPVGRIKRAAKGNSRTAKQARFALMLRNFKRK